MTAIPRFGIRRARLAVAAFLCAACPRTETRPGPAPGGPAPSEPEDASPPTPKPVPRSAPDPAADPAADPRPGGAAPPAGSGNGPRTVVVAHDHPLHGRLEGEGLRDTCTTDADCHSSGCSGEVCTAEDGIMTTCEAPPVDWPADASCGCVGGTCQWWTPSGETLAVPPPMPTPDPGLGPAVGDRGGVPCGEGRCKPGETCISYYGIAGPNGPKFETCGIRCKPGPGDGGCPKGMRCVTIADGPGPVCR